jgi:hypothetical protein
MKLLLLALLLACSSAFSQNNVNGDDAPFNKFSIDILAPLNFNFQSTPELFQVKTIPNAIQLNLKMKQENIGVFGQAVFHSSVPSPFENKMSLSLKYSNSPNVVSPAPEIFLLTAPTLILSQSGGTRSTKHYKYLYDLKLYPPSTFEGLQSQNYSIIYTFSIL